jgi:N-acetylated-alpha-linked acidic dipeptidase
MTGEEAPESWQGGLPFTYRLGPGSTKARISLDIEFESRPVNDVIVRIPGSKQPDQTVLIGAHHDAWVYGASDNRSGWATAMEVARVLGEMYQDGWRPERTIVIAGWDGEEYGLLGSCEWVEEHRDRLIENSVAYLNMDGIAGQFFGASAVPSLNQLIYSVTRQVAEPRSGFSIYEDWSTRSGGDVPSVGYLGGGSDYTGFLQHLGISSISMGFNAPSGLYHSAYDNTDSIERFKDPGYKHHAAATRIIGQMALRLANADILPMEYSEYANAVSKLITELSDQYTMGVDLSPLADQAKIWQAASTIVEIQAENALTDGNQSSDDKDLSSINKALMQQERDLTQPVGLPGRKWFKHQIWAPGLNTGYAVQPMPALAEAIKAGDKEALQKAADVLMKSLESATQTAQSAIMK